MRFTVSLSDSAAFNILYDHLNNCGFKNMIEKGPLQEHKDRTFDPLTNPHIFLTLLTTFTHQKFLKKKLLLTVCKYWTSQVAQWQRIHTPVLEMWVPSLGWEDPLEESMATHSNILA